MDIGDTVIGNRGHVAVGSVLAAYFVVFGLIDAKSTQEETRASLERSLFITLVSSGNTASFVVAMKDFGPIQTMPATEHPSWFRFWAWGRNYQPNNGPMLEWAVWRLPLCDAIAKDCSTDGKQRIGLAHADLDYADLRNARLEGANLSFANLSGARLEGTNLRPAALDRANLSGADLTGARLKGQAQLDDACGTPAQLPKGLHAPKPCPHP